MNGPSCARCLPRPSLERSNPFIKQEAGRTSGQVFGGVFLSKVYNLWPPSCQALRLTGENVTISPPRPVPPWVSSGLSGHGWPDIPLCHQGQQPQGCRPALLHLHCGEGRSQQVQVFTLVMRKDWRAKSLGNVRRKEMRWQTWMI